MLLSMYASYQLANHNKIIYVFSMVVFVVLGSYFSAFSPVSFVFLLTFPFTLFSFPFYSYMTPILIENYGWADFYKIRLLTIDLTSPLSVLSPEESLSVEMGAFWVFLAVNVIGAVLGYGASRIRGNREWGTTKTWNLIGVILGITLIGIGYWFGSAFGRGPYGIDVMALALFFYGIIVLAIVVGKILWSKIQDEYQA